MYIVTIVKLTGLSSFNGSKDVCMAIAHAVEKAQLEDTNNGITSICVEDALDLDAEPCFETYC